MMLNGYRAAAKSVLGAAASWQKYEAALYGIRAVGVRSYTSPCLLVAQPAIVNGLNSLPLFPVTVSKVVCSIE